MRISLTESEYEVLTMLGEQWGVPTATAAYGLLGDCIAKCRRQKGLAMPDNIVYAASLLVARYNKQMEQDNS
jgi:hypothetical protein